MNNLIICDSQFYFMNLFQIVVVDRHDFRIKELRFKYKECLLPGNKMLC